MGPPQNDAFFALYPSTKMAITPLLVYQIEKFQCLELSTAPKLSPGIFRCHMACVTCPQMWLIVSELWGLFTNKVADEIFQKSLFLLPRLVLNYFQNKIQCAIFFVRPIELRQCDRNTSDCFSWTATFTVKNETVNEHYIY